MDAFLRRRAATAADSSGAPGSIGQAPPEPAVLERITYDAAGAKSLVPASLAECAGFADGPGISWINVCGLRDAGLNAQLGEQFHIHPLALEDIVNTVQRPKTEELRDGSLFVIVKTLAYDESRRQVVTEQASFILGKRYLLSFQERPEGGAFDEVRKRLLAQKGRLLSLGPDALLHALLDSIVDKYFAALERMGEDIEEIEERLLSRPRPEHLEALHALRREGLFLRKHVFPLREVVAGLEKGGNDLIADNTVFYLRDLYDHVIQVMDTVETFRDMLAGMVELYLSNISLKMNEIMKVLAMFTSLFTPLTFIAGVYGMNFENMPELRWPYGYFAALGVMALIATGMLLYFRRKGWIGNGSA